VSDNVQLTHADHKKSDRQYPLSIIASDLSSPLNVGSLFRLSDALGIKTLYLCGDTPAPPNAKINKTSRSAEKYVAFESHDNAEELIVTLKQSGSIIIALEITTDSLDINSAEFKSVIKQSQSVSLILGSENSGVNEKLLALAEVAVYIPMSGNNSSMNVVTAASIACFEITKNLL